MTYYILILLIIILTNNKVFIETLYYYLIFNFQLISPFGVPVPGPAPETKDIKNLYESIINNYINILNKLSKSLSGLFIAQLNKNIDNQQRK